jgi:acetyl-CoA carboxylase carboxyl transferase subunit alpha
MEVSLEFEKPIIMLEKKLQDLRDLSQQEGMNLKSEIQTIESKLSDLIQDTYSKLTPWQRVQLSRHPQRPYTLDYISALFPTFKDISGDRLFGEDAALVAGVAYWQHGSEKPFPMAIVGHQKGRSTKQKMERNFGMVRPEGYRKAMRLLDMAERFKMPVLSFIDTPGAYPGIEAEERGQSQAIAESIAKMLTLNVPSLAVVIGEGGSGGALAIGATNRVLMQEYSTYSVISPESCASILWSDSRLAESASEKLKMSPKELMDLGVVDGIIHEPKGGAHRNWDEAMGLMKKALAKEIHALMDFKTHAEYKDPRKHKLEKFRAMGSLAMISGEGHGSGATANKKLSKKKSGT